MVIKMELKLKDAKISSAGNYHYIRIPNNYVKNELIDTNERYAVLIRPQKEFDELKKD